MLKPKRTAALSVVVGLVAYAGHDKQVKALDRADLRRTHPVSSASDAQTGRRTVKIKRIGEPGGRRPAPVNTAGTAAGDGPARATCCTRSGGFARRIDLTVAEFGLKTTGSNKTHETERR